jgi:hypothetical protein
MKAIYIIGGLFLLFIPLISSKRHLAEYEVQKQGQLVKVVLTSIPQGKGFINFAFNADIYDKKVGRTFYQDYKVGDTLVLRYKEGGDIFLFEKENIENEFIAMGLLGLFGIAMLVKGLKK